MRFLTVTALVVVLAGCAADYYKPGASERDLANDRTACNAQSLRDAPPAMTSGPFGTGYNNVANANCFGGFGAVTCNPINPIGSGNVPPPSLPTDINGGKRTALFESCMAGRGWSREKPDPAESGR
jgi:hypothetical protein